MPKSLDQPEEDEEVDAVCVKTVDPSPSDAKALVVEAFPPLLDRDAMSPASFPAAMEADSTGVRRADDVLD